MDPDMVALPSPDASRRDDNPTLWPTYAGCVLAVLATVLLSWPVASLAFTMLIFLWGPPLALAVAACLICAVVQLISALLQRRWKRAASVMMLPFIIVASLPVVANSDRLSNIIHFRLFQTAYTRSIASDPLKPRYFDWGGSALNGFSRALIYDPTDQIMAAKSQQPETGRAQMSNFLGPDYHVVQRVAEHFYVVDQ
jgi:hypothetical protein